MTFVVWAGTVFGTRLWQLSARRRSLAGMIVNSFLLKLQRQTEHLDLFFYDLHLFDSLYTCNVHTGKSCTDHLVPIS